LPELQSGPATAALAPRRSSIWPSIYPRILEQVLAHRSTIVFCNSRRQAERLAAKLNELAEEQGIGVDPDTGRLLWSHPHDPGSDMNNSTPIWGDDGILFVSSAYDGGSRGLRVTREGGTTRVEELWFTARMRLMFTNGIRLGHHVYGTDAAFGPAFVTAIDVRTGEIAWRERGFARANLPHADGRFIILDEDGTLALARLSPSGMTVLARTSLFDTTAWTVPTLSGTTLYARDRERIVALELH
jgi:hypothetical protein